MKVGDDGVVGGGTRLDPLALHALPVAWRPTPDGMTLTDAEIADGYVLACSCHPQSDLVLA